MRAFRCIWLGQSAAELGAGLTSFALGVWAYQLTGSAMQFAMIVACRLLPGLLVAPVVGTLIDRWNLRAALLLGHVGALLGATCTVLLLACGKLQIWHLYVITSGISAVTSLRWPAFISATTRLVPQAQLGRAAGAAQLGESMAQLLSPALGGILLGVIGLWGVVMIEVMSLGVALASCAVSRIPTTSSPPTDGGWRALIRDTTEGFSYLRHKPGLLGMLGLACILTCALSFLEVLSAPIVLAVGSSAELGLVRSIAGAGMLVGSILMATWGGPRERILGVVRFQTMLGLFIVLMAIARGPWTMAAAGFCGLLCVPVVNTCAQTLWQTKVELHLQGRVFALRRVTGLFRSLGLLAAGVLADQVFTTYMQELEPDTVLGWVIGVGDGRGSALALALMGGITAAATSLAYLHRPLREIERELPDVNLSDLSEEV